MKTITWDQSTIEEECTFVGEEHAYFEHMLVSEASEVSADKIIVSCAALTLLQSSAGKGFQRRTNVAFASDEGKQDDAIYAGTLNDIPVYVNQYLREDDNVPAAQIIGSVDTVHVMINHSTVSFI